MSTPPALRKFHKRLVFRLLVAFGTASTLVLAVALYISAGISTRVNLDEHEKTAMFTASLLARRFDAQFSHDAAMGHQLASLLEHDPSHQEHNVEMLVRSFVASSRTVFGIGASWMPRAFDPQRERYSVYGTHAATSDGVKLVALESVYDYTMKPWFTTPIAQGRAGWSEPYFGQAGGVQMITYSVPVMSAGHPVGVVTVDVSLEQLTRAATELRPTPAGYGFLVNRSGELLAWPEPASLGRDNLRTRHPLLADQLLTMEPGFFKTTNPITGEPAWIAWSPIPSAGLVVGLVLPEKEVLNDTILLRWTLLAVGIVELIVLLGVTALLARSITWPVEQLLQAVRQATAGDLNKTFPMMRYDDEMAELASSFNQMMHDLRLRIDEVTRVTAERARLQRDVQIGSEIQRSFLPAPRPARAGIHLHAHSEQAMQVGGDFYDYFDLPDGRLVLAIGDACGEGIPAALFMAVTLTQLRANMRTTLSPARTLTLTNDLLCSGNDACMFTTAVIGILDPVSGRFVWSNAGHPRPLRQQTDGCVHALESRAQPALGMVAGTAYNDHETRLQAGERLVLFSDGAIEQHDTLGQVFSEQKLMMLLEGRASAPPEALVKQILDTIYAFGAHVWQDDTSILALDYGQHFALRIEAATTSLPQVEAWLSEVATATGLTPREVADINLVLEELAMNVIHHGFNNRGGGHDLHIAIRRDADHLVIRFEDDSPPFDPRTAPHAPDATDVDETAIGGRGLRLIRHKTQSLDYETREGRNVTTFRMSLDTPRSSPRRD